MRKFFENPEMMINVFDIENVVTASDRDLTPGSAKDAIAQENSDITLDGQSGNSIAKATQIFSFNE